MIGIINYGSGNVYAIANLHNRASIPHFVSDDVNKLKTADKLILPGVGAFDETMQMLKRNGLKDFLDEQVLVVKKPIIGVCVGMQILGESSEEGSEPGFGWIKGKVNKIDKTHLTQKPYLPHLGWNSIQIENKNDLLEGIVTTLSVKTKTTLLPLLFMEKTLRAVLIMKTSLVYSFILKKAIVTASNYLKTTQIYKYAQTKDSSMSFNTRQRLSKNSKI
jgi:imidazole glycerol phosphate synthase glutamine amidotransferase subunit